MKKLVLLGLVVFAFAAYQSATGNGIESGQATEGARLGKIRPILGGDAQCVVLGGSGYVPSACLTGEGDTAQPVPGAVPSAEVVSAGDFGGMGHGTVLSMEEVARLWVAAGGNPSEGHLAAAIATAESGRRPAAVNGSNSDGSIDRGLFQMNSIHGGCSTFDLAENVRCAVQLRGSANGWNHWVAYKSGAYRKYL